MSALPGTARLGKGGAHDGRKHGAGERQHLFRAEGRRRRDSYFESRVATAGLSVKGISISATGSFYRRSETEKEEEEEREENDRITHSKGKRRGKRQ